MIRVFLDANILFSAAYMENSGILRLWKIKTIRLVTSPYALAEAERNIKRKRPNAMMRLSKHTAAIEISHATKALKHAHALPEKDQPVLAAAIASGCAVLLTGDIAHFGHLFGKKAEGTMIMTVSMFLKNLGGNS